MKLESRSLELAEKVLSLKNFKLKALCRKAKDKGLKMEFDPRDNSSMREALWNLSDKQLQEIMNAIK